MAAALVNRCGAPRGTDGRLIWPCNKSCAWSGRGALCTGGSRLVLDGLVSNGELVRQLGAGLRPHYLRALAGWFLHASHEGRGAMDPRLLCYWGR